MHLKQKVCLTMYSPKEVINKIFLIIFEDIFQDEE